MKKNLTLLAAMVIITIAFSSCERLNYQKAKSGLLYKIIPSGSKDSVVREGEWLKFYFTQKINDSLLQSNYDKMPIYVQLRNDPQDAYNPAEIFHLLRKGDSAVTVAIADSLLTKNLIPELPPFIKKGDRLVTNLRVVEIFRNDSLYQADAEMEAEKDRPRRIKEQEEQMAQMLRERREQRLQEELEMERSGEAAKGIAQMEAWLKQKNIPAQKTGKGTFVLIREQGTGPMADSGKYITVKYTGRTLEKDSIFESNTFPLQVGVGRVIPGWDEGLQLFKEGGKGTLYIPGFRAYGKNNPASFKPFEPLIFDVEILKVSDTIPKETDPQVQ